MTDWNILDPAVRENPYPFYARIRDHAPAVKIEPFGLWMIGRHRDVVDVLRRVDEFSSRGNRRSTGGLPESAGAPNIITADNPHHDRLRSIMQKRFTPKRLERLQARVETLTDELLANVRGREGFDLVREFTIPLPVIVIADVLGIETTRFEDFKQWSDDLVQVMNGTTGEAGDRAREGLKALAGYLAGMADRRRAEPGDDLIGALVKAEQEPGRIDAREVLSYCVLLLAAGNETTTNLIGGMALELLDDPEQLEMLRQDPSLLRNAIEEGLRYCSPVQGLFRRATREVEVDGIVIPEGEEVMVCYASANHDGTRFSDPDRFDITRDCSGHVAFGWGLHFCLGANLARREARVALGRLLPVLGQLQRESDRVEWVDSWFLRGPRSLPLRWAA